jgi:hypothetical protein
MQQDPDLSSARAKLNWANSQINILDAEIRGFIDRKPYRIWEKPKPKLQREPNAAQRDLFEKGRFFKIILTEDIPIEFKVAAGMIIQAIRDSLDHLTHALAKKNGAVKTTDVGFVIAPSESEFLGTGAQRKLRRLSETDRQIITALKPYKGGNDLLYSLHWLNNKSKHRELMAIATGADEFGFGGGPDHIRRMLILPPGNTFSPDEQIICIDADQNMQFNLTSTVAFREIGHAQGQPVIETLREFSRLSNSIIDLFS